LVLIGVKSGTLEGSELNKNKRRYYSSMEELIQFATFQAWSCSLAAQTQLNWKKVQQNNLIESDAQIKKKTFT
jgi:hypothetical protein